MRILSLKNKNWREKALLLREEDIRADLRDKGGTTLFLGKYSLSEIIAVLRKRNFEKEAKKRNLWPLVFQLNSSEFPLQRFQIFYQEKKPEKIIVDLKIKEGFFIPRDSLLEKLHADRYRFLFLEWLTLQNPLKKFTEDQIPLPGQKHPGLKLSRKVMDVFVYLARLIKAEGILAFPAYFHNAVLFNRYFHFFNPEKEGELTSIRKESVSLPLKQVAWIVHWNCLKKPDGSVYEWKAEEQVYPLSSLLKQYFSSNYYREKTRQAASQVSFNIDWSCFQDKMSKKEWMKE